MMPNRGLQIGIKIWENFAKVCIWFDYSTISRVRIFGTFFVSFTGANALL